MASASTDQVKNPLTRWAWLSITAALATMALKFSASWVTGSASLLSDAMESSVNLLAALTVLGAIWYSLRPADRDHPYGHEKIEFFASAVEGGMIVLAAGWIIWFAVGRLFDPQPVESLGLGLVIALVATVINFFTARVLLREASDHNSVVLHADGRHLMTDVWTSLGVGIGLVLANLTGSQRIDPLIAIAVAVGILVTGGSLLRSAFDGLMDTALPVEDLEAVRLAIVQELPPNSEFHALRTRRAGSRRFVDFHVLVPGSTSVRRSHQIAVDMEERIADAMPGAETTIHIEPVEDPRSWADSLLIGVEPTSAEFFTSDPHHSPNGAHNRDGIRASM